MSNQLGNELDILQKRVKGEYENGSIIDQVCRLVEEPNGKKGDFEWITKTTGFPKHNLVAENIVTNPTVDNILVQETKYVLDNIRNNSTTVHLDGDELNSIRRYTVEFFNEQDILAIIIPRSLWINVPDWNRTINPNLKENSNKVLYLGYPKKSVRVVIPPQGVEFNDIIITGRICNRLHFIPNKDKFRLHVGYEIDQTNIPFYLHAWYRYEKSELDCNVTIQRGTNN